MKVEQSSVTQKILKNVPTLLAFKLAHFDQNKSYLVQNERSRSDLSFAD